MKRYHLFEFEDLPWYPQALRDYTTDFLQFMVNRFDFYQGLVPLLQRGMDRAGSNQILDLASGSGGGWPKLLSHFKSAGRDVSVVLTDLYPNQHAFDALEALGDGRLVAEREPVNALNVPPRYSGLRTQFLSFHHFRPNSARQILQNAVDCRAPIIIVEIQNRDGINLLKHMLSPISVLLCTPLIRPFRWGRLLFTYVIPVVPATVWWDGLVSVLRTYRAEELRDMVASLDASETFTWEIGVDTSAMAPVHFIAGFPTDVAQRST